MFLAISIGFWFLTTLKDVTTTQVTYRVNITDKPSNIIFTGDIQDAITANITGRGWDLLQYRGWDMFFNPWSDKVHTITFSYKDFNSKSGIINVTNQDIRKAVTKEITNNPLTITSTFPSSFRIYFTLGEKKKVPIIFNGNVQVEPQHLLNHIDVIPDSATVLAPASILDSITYVKTQYVNEHNLQDTIQKLVLLDKIEGAKINPDTVLVRYCVDVFTEKVIEISDIFCVNIPSNKVLRTFPTKVKVKFNVSAALYNQIKAKDFIVTVDYNSIKPGDRYCKFILSSMPKGISHATVIPDQAEYVIELIEDTTF